MKLTQDEINNRKAEVAEAKRQRRALMPEPSNTKVTDDHRMAVAYINQQSADKLVITYLREEPSLSKVADTGNEQYKFCRGNPYGILIAFSHEGKNYVGWAKRHPKYEPMKFTKKRARHAAILRGLTDTITIGPRGVTSGNDKVIPIHIARHIPSFLDKARKYLSDDLTNVEVV